MHYKRDFTSNTSEINSPFVSQQLIEKPTARKKFRETHMLSKLNYQLLEIIREVFDANITQTKQRDTIIEAHEGYKRIKSEHHLYYSNIYTNRLDSLSFFRVP